MPSPAALQEAVIEVLANVSRRPITPTLESDLVTDLAFDSLQVMEAISALEDRFQIAIPQDDLAGTRTVSQVVERIAALLDDQQRQ
jgi:acyl carrier protein